MHYKNVAHGAVGLAASSLLVVACADGGPLGNASFGFGTEMATSNQPTDDDAGTFNPADTSAGPGGEASTNAADGLTTGDETTGPTSVGSTSLEGSSSGDGGPKCDGVALEAGEECDGSDLGGEDCVSQGFDEGTLACAADCTLDTSSCSTFTCGNGTIEGSEVCDGAQLGGQTCVSQGFDMGTLTCLGTCGGYDTSGCSNIVCGNGVLEAGEVCDGAQLGGQTCVSQGFDGGNLACSAGCASYNTGGCTSNCVEQDLGSATGAGVAAGSTAGEDDTLAPSCVGGGADHVMSFTAPVAGNYTFDTFGSGYDTALAVFGDCTAGSQLACNDDSGGLQSSVAVALAAGQTVNVVVDGFGGATGNWILNITSPVPPLPACAEQDLGSALGNPVANGTTVGQDEDLTQSCGGAGAVDYVLRFVAPAAATFQFDTIGSGYDTVLSLHDTCGGAAVACNDDFSGLQSQVTYAMAAGQQVLIAVSGYAGNTGNWTLNINQL